MLFLLPLDWRRWPTTLRAMRRYERLRQKMSVRRLPGGAQALAANESAAESEEPERLPVPEFTPEVYGVTQALPWWRQEETPPVVEAVKVEAVSAERTTPGEPIEPPPWWKSLPASQPFPGGLTLDPAALQTETVEVMSHDRQTGDARSSRAGRLQEERPGELPDPGSENRAVTEADSAEARDEWLQRAQYQQGELRQTIEAMRQQLTRPLQRPFDALHLVQQVEAAAQSAAAQSDWHDAVELAAGADWPTRWEQQQRWVAPVTGQRLSRAYLQLAESAGAQGVDLETQWRLCLLAFRADPSGIRACPRAAALADGLHLKTPEAEMIRRLAQPRI